MSGSRVFQEILDFVEDFIVEHGDKLWTSPLLDAPDSNMRLVTIWSFRRNRDGELERLEVVNDIVHAQDVPSYDDPSALIHPEGWPMFLSVLPAPVREYTTEYVLDNMFGGYALYGGRLSMLE